MSIRTITKSLTGAAAMIMGLHPVIAAAAFQEHKPPHAARERAGCKPSRTTVTTVSCLSGCFCSEA